MINRKEKIREYIQKKTIELLNADKINDNGIEAEDISYNLRIDRANVSRELNALWKNGVLIKIAGRPVFYLDSKIISDAYPESYIPTFIPKEGHLSDYINAANTYQSPYDNKLDLNNMIGADGSLAEVIKEAKAAISYPPYGLHTLITGNSGTEKSTLADSMVEYAIRNGFKNKRCPYFDIDCRRANANITQFEEKLFGFQDEYNKENSRKGILEMCTNGFLLLQNIDFLPQSTVDLISSLLNKGYFTRMNSTAQIPVRFMMILISARDLKDPELLPFTHYITANIALPDMDDRGIYEKLVMIMDCFAREARNIKKSIRVSKDVLAAYAFKVYKENITKLENEIRDACSHSFAESIGTNAPYIDVTLSSLPKEVTSYDRSSLTNPEAEQFVPMMLGIIYNDHILYDSNGHSDEFEYFKEYPQKTAYGMKEQLTMETDAYSDPKQMTKSVQEKIDIIKNCNSQQLSELKRGIDPEVRSLIDSIIFHHREYAPISTHREYLYGLYFHIGNLINRNAEYSVSYIADEEDLPSSESIEYTIACEIAGMLKDHYQIIVSDSETAYFSLYLKEIMDYFSRSKVSILAIAHGESVASQMVAHVKKYSNREVVMEALDFPDGMNFDEFLSRAIEKAKRIDAGSGILIVVDREPLTDLGTYISKATGIPCKTMAPITLERLFDLCDKSSYSINSLGDLSSLGLKNGTYNYEGEESFIIDLIEKKIAPICHFIDPYKAVSVFRHCLRSTIAKLNIDYSDSLAADYYIQCSEMLERVIRNEPIQNKKLYRFISGNHQLVQTVTRCLETVNRAYSIRIQQPELAAIAKIFLPYVKRSGQ